MFKKILIANRGEIAVRIIRACRDMDIKTVGVYSEADRSALHVQEADEAICIGPPPPTESYLNMDHIIRAAQTTGAEAIHPGYGFLAENYKFSRRCRDENIVFIGPEPQSQKLVGDKVAARKTLSRENVPLIPGMKSTSKDFQVYHEAAEKIGYPVMIKASAGGGGKGMRIALSPDKLKSCIEEGRREAGSAFGDDSIYLEKCIVNPRHIEFQVLADQHGNSIHLFERECSIQRRHQKIVEETPSPSLNQKLRREMGEAALNVVKATGYTNAGTVEFLLDENKNFYFLEVNARIQVEHPITELVTGVDLVKWQILIAAGEKLKLKQESLKQRGHAIESRIYAEDPSNSFFPSLGKIQLLQNPEGPGIRVDSGIYSGYEVSRFYDPILSKLITWGENREMSRKRMITALTNYIIMGIETTIPFLKDVMNHKDFITGKTMTNFIEKNFKCWNREKESKYFVPALIAAAVCSQNRQKTTDYKSRKVYNPWTTVGKWQVGGETVLNAEDSR
ncbi:MAG: acetyl-CoA carboxylase biotin carboxylase subunit [bacterium]